MTELKKKEKRKRLAKWVKERLLRLGPTFIKIGQQFSTRVDILAQEYVDELAELQDQVPPFESETAMRIIETKLGQPVDVIFDRFDRDPIVAANVGEGLEGLKALEQGGNVDESPVEQVRLTVPNTDDPSMPVWTFRMWTIGLLFCF